MTFVFKQNYTTVPLPPADEYEPKLAVTVIVPVRSTAGGTSQAKLNLVLAGLANQNYPTGLLNVIVVDDGSPTPVTLPTETAIPPDTQLLVLEDEGSSWGKARAFNAALNMVDTPLVMSLDADMLLEPSHMRSLARYVETIPCSVALGYKRIVTTWEPDPGEVDALIKDGNWLQTAAGPGARHDWFEDIVDSTGDLAFAGPDVFKAFVGASVLTTTRLFRKIGGYDEAMRLAEDTEIGYRLVQAGAILIPVRGAHAWHLGETAMMHDREAILAHNWSLLGPRVPHLDYLRRGGNARRMLVPTVHANVHVTEETAGPARELVTALVSGRLAVDATVTLVADWPAESRYRVQDDDSPALRALRNVFAGETAVTISTVPVVNAYPTPYLLDVTGDTPLSGARHLLDRLRRDDFGVVAAAGETLIPGTVAAWRTSAVSRAQECEPSEHATPAQRVAAAGRAGGVWWVDATTIGPKPRTSDTSIGVPAGGSVNALLRHAKAAWLSWVRAGYSPAAARTIASGLSRGASRRGRRVLKRRLDSAASKL